MIRVDMRRLGGAVQRSIIVAVVSALVVVGALMGSSALMRQMQPPTTANDAPVLGDARAGAISRTDRGIGALQERLRQYASPAGQTALALGYLQKARETSDPSYYTRADTLLRQAHQDSPEDADTLIGLGTLALARHDFEAGLAWGQQAVARAPSRAAAYGVLADALIELGRYDEAVTTVQRMVDLRPDQASYSRVSYLRELHGDRAGAITAMQSAVQAGAAGAEGTEWARVQLGHLYFGEGNLADAERSYQEAVERLPGYVHAQGGLARVAAARGDTSTAIQRYTEATGAIPVPELVIHLGEVYRAVGQTDAADRQDALVRVMQQLSAANGMDTDLEMALFDADRRVALDDAVIRARAQWETRKSVHVADVLAWTLYRSNACQEADELAREALRLGTRDALMLFHAGRIAECVGDRPRAARLLNDALTLNPHFSLLYASEARRVLDAIGASQDGGRR